MSKRLLQTHYSTALDPRTIRTREALKKALLSLLVEQSLEQITIRDIAKRANVSYVTFYRHHETKESLLQDIATEEVKRLAALTLPAINARDTLAASTALCVYVDYNRKLWSTLLTGGAASIMKEEFLKNSMELAAEVSTPDAWLPPELAVSLNITCTIEVLTWWLSQRKPVPISRVAEIHEQTVIKPIFEAANRGWPSLPPTLPPALPPKPSKRSRKRA